MGSVAIRPFGECFAVGNFKPNASQICDHKENIETYTNFEIVKMSGREGEPPPRPKIFVGNSQQMLRDIKQSLKHLTRQPEARISQQTAASNEGPKINATVVDPRAQQASGVANRPMVHNPNRRFSGHAKALAEIRSSLKPFETPESGYSSCSESSTCAQPAGESINKQVLEQLRAIGLDDEVCV